MVAKTEELRFILLSWSFNRTQMRMKQIKSKVNGLLCESDKNINGRLCDLVCIK